MHLRDGEGKDHLVLADMGCRNTVFNAQAQSGAEYVHELVAAGVRRFRGSWWTNRGAWWRR